MTNITLKSQIDKAIKQSYQDWYIDYAFKSMEWYIDLMNKYWRLWDETPRPKLTEIIKWFIRWKVYTIWAYSNIWKSKFAYNIVNHVIWLWKSVIFFSLEVDSWMVLQNLMCNKYWLQFSDFTSIDTSKLLAYEFYKNLKIYDNVYKLDQIEEVIQKFKPDYVFIDFIQNIQVNWWSKYEKMAEIAIKVQQMAIYNKTTIFSLSQLSNEMWKEVWRWIDDFLSLKWAWELFASSDVIMLLRREDDNLIMKIKKNKYWRINDEFWFEPDFSKWQFKLLPKY